MCIKFLYQYLKTITEISCYVMALNVAQVREMTSLWLLGNEFTDTLKDVFLTNQLVRMKEHGKNTKFENPLDN